MRIMYFVDLLGRDMLVVKSSGISILSGRQHISFRMMKGMLRAPYLYFISIQF